MRMNLLLGFAFSIIIVTSFTTHAHSSSINVAGVSLKKNIKPMREIKRTNVVTQSLDFSCGTAGLSTLFNYYLNTPVSEQEIIESLLTIIPIEKVRERRGFSLYDLKKFAQEHGYEATGYQMDMDFLRELKKPILVPIKFKNYRHFVVVRGVVGDRVFIADPAAGNLSMKVDKFQKVWTNGIGLLIEKKTEETAQLTQKSHLDVEEDDLLLSDYKSIRRLVSTDLIQTAIHPTEW